MSFEGECAEFGRLDHVAQCDGLAARDWALRFRRWISRDALDQNRFGAQREAKVFGKARDPAVLDSRFGLEFECGDDRAGIDLRDLAVDFEFRAFLLDGAGAFLQLGSRPSSRRARRCAAGWAREACKLVFPCEIFGSDALFFGEARRRVPARGTGSRAGPRSPCVGSILIEQSLLLRPPCEFLRSKRAAASPEAVPQS